MLEGKFAASCIAYLPCNPAARVQTLQLPFSFSGLPAFLDPCVYGEEDCHGRKNCEPLDGPFGVCRCDRFLGFTGVSCDEPTSATYVLIAMIAVVVASSVAVVVVCTIVNKFFIHTKNISSDQIFGGLFAGEFALDLGGSSFGTHLQ
jgi:hypothetical protein